MLLGSKNDGYEHLIYNPHDGSLTMQDQKPASAIEIESTSGYFTGERPDILTGVFDAFTPGELFLKLR